MNAAAELCDAEQVELEACFACAGTGSGRAAIVRSSCASCGGSGVPSERPAREALLGELAEVDPLAALASCRELLRRQLRAFDGGASFGFPAVREVRVAYVRVCAALGQA